MNNKGFAITTILYGLLILFCMLLISLLGILSTYKNNMEKLIENTNGARDILEISKLSGTDKATDSGIYIDCRTNEICEYKYVEEGS